MRGFVFDLQRFATQSIAEGAAYELDGVTFTAVDGDATLNLDDNGKVSGIASGKIQATVADASDSPKVTFDATDGAFNFTATSDGEVISITPFPIEFIGGEFTYKGNRIDITAGSDLAIVTQRGNFVLRNQNHFVTDSAYIFTSTSLTSESEHVISYFSLTNGDDVRELNLEQLGTVINHFDQQGATLVKGSSEVLNIGDYKLTATAEKADAGLNFELGESGLTFVPNTGDGTLNVSLVRDDTTIFDGELECTSGSITLGYDHAVTFAKDTSFNFTTKNNTVLTVTANGEATTNIALTDNGITFTPGTGDGGLDISLSKKGTQVFEGSLNITDGTITFDTNEKKFSFSDGTKISLGIFGLEMDIEVVGNTTVGSGLGSNFKIAFDDNGNFIFTPDENGGSFNIALKRELTDNADLAEDVETFFKNNVTVNGPIMFNPETGMLTLLDDTEISLAFDEEKGYTLTATAQGDAASKISLTEEGISITPQQGDGTLKLALGSANGSMSVDIEVLSGGFLFGENGALNVVEGTELQLTFSNEYSVKFKTTDKAGGALKLGEDGITFTPNADDGHLELTVTRGDETRTTSLEMTGSLTYKLDGSISLAEGTVLKNVFEDGNILTITALTDASGSIIFHPAIGLQITPSTPDALNVVLTSGDIDVFNITSINGSVYYQGGVITASDGTEARFTNYYMDSEMKLSTSGGFSSLEITEESTSYIANEGATFVLDYQDKTTLEITGGKFIDDYEHAIVTAGSTFKTNDDEDYFYLQTAGDYNLNGMNVTTTAAMSPVMLSNYDTVIVDGISYTALDENAQLNLDNDGKVSGIASGKVEAVITGKTDPAITFDATDGAFNFTAVLEDDTLNVGYNDVKIHYTGGALTYTANSIEIPAGEVSVVGSGGIPINATINFPAAATATFADGVISADVSNVSGSVSVYGAKIGTLSLDGEISFNQTTREVNFAKDASINVNLPFLNDYTISLTALDNVGGIFAFNTDPMGVKFTPNSGDGALGIVLKEGGETNFDGSINCRAGSLIFGLDGGLRVTDGTILDVTIGGMTATLKTTGDDSAKIGLNDGKITLTPGTDGAMDISVDFIDIAGKFSLKSGSVTFDPSTKEITLVKDTELQIDFGNDYVVSMKTTNDAGGVIAINNNSITFTPNSGDGNLELTITKGDETRTATVDVTGTVTYNLDGSISLAEGTVVKNHFYSGANLTITAKTDSDGSIIFDPSSGLTIKNDSPGALKAELEHDTIFVFDDIIGSITYNSGSVTVHDGTTAVSWFEASDYQSAKGTCSSTGGDTTIDFASPMQVYSVAEGATYKVEEDEEFWELSRGNLCGTFYEGETVYLLTESSVVNANETIKFLLESAGNYTLNGVDVTTTADNVKVQLIDGDTITVDGISYTPQDEDATLTIDEDGATVSGGKVSMQMEGFSQVSNFDTTDGSISYDSTTNKFTVAKGAKAYINDEFPDQFVAQGDFEISVEKNSDGTFTFSTDDSVAFAIERNGNVIIGSTLTLDGSIIVNPSNNQITLPQDTTVTMTPGDGNILEIKALDDAGGELTLVEGGIRFAPNAGDGALELNFATSERKVQLDVTGAFTYKGLGALSLEDGTEATFTWEDGNTLQLTSSGSTGAIGINPDKGIKITSNDENLSMKFTSDASGDTTEVSSIQGSLWYKEGIVTIEEGTKLTAKGSIGGQAVDVTLEAQGGDGYLIFGTTGITYGADTGALKITYTLNEATESTFVVNEGSVFIGHDIFTIAEGSDLATDLKDFIPALNFTTSEAGTYTINGQTIKTSAEGLDLTATDDYMSFKTSDDVVEYDGMTFAGAGNVSLKPDIVVLGKDVVATGFGEGNSFMLAEAGNVTADAKVFELTEQENKLGEEIPLNVSVEGATDGFIFSRTITRESEDYFDDPDYDNVGKIFTEKFIVHNDDSYRTRTDPLGLQEVIGISGGASIEGGATLGDKVSPSYYDLVTDTNGSFTIGENTYKIADDTEVGVVLHAAFEDGLSYASAVKNLNGTISGNFSDGGFAINGNDSLNVYGDKEISIVADSSGYEILGLDDGASLKVSATDSYVVNGTTINANAGDYIVGFDENSAYRLSMSNDTLITGTENDDYIANGGTNVTINALAGNDTIMNYVADSVKVNAGAGYDYIVNTGSAVTIDGAEDNDIVFNIARFDSETDEVISSPDNVSINGGSGDDFIAAEGSNVTISGGAGNDSIAADGDFASIDAGAGSNQINLSGKNEVILLKGQTTVEGFNTGFGEGSDTIYINTENDPAGVEFLEDGLTFGNETASLTLSDVNTTAKVNLFHENRDVLNKGVFIAAGDWYKVEDSDLTLNAGEEVYFVGTASDPKAGLDFSDISSDLNVTMNTAYIDSEDYVENTPFWVNGVYSLKGGAGNTTITGSTEDDTIITGSGSTTINASGGDDLISLTGGAALINYTSGDGNDTIYGFNSNATLSPDSAYTTQVSGNDLIVNVGKSKITLKDAASLSYPNISSSDDIVHLAETILKRTALGYPAMAAAVFDPTGNYGDEPTNYSAKEDWTITSKDDLKLHAVHYTPENSNDKWVVLIHGYGNNHTAMYTYAESYLANGYNVLMIDQRAAGESEGTWLTMGAAESADVALWTREIARRNLKAKITLHGVSMGAATALLAAARSDTKNVTSVVEDCGYSDVMETFSIIIANSPQLAEQGIVPEVVPYLNPVAESLTGYPLTAAAPIDSISSVQKPSLFISGDADSVAPVSMLEELYDESGAEVKEKFIVEGAKHALAVFDDSIGYNNAVFRFVAEADGEGWVTTNTTDGISLRGTKYGDTITNSGDDVTINGGKGDDSLVSTGDYVQFDYTEGDGKDTIYGFNSTDMLSISGADFTAHKSGDDIVVSVNKENITLADAATVSSTLSIVNQSGSASDIIINLTNNTLVTGTDEGDYIINSGTTVTIQGYAGNDYIENNVDSSLVAAELGNSIDAGSGNDTIYSFHTYNPTLLGGDGNDSIVVSHGHLTYVDGGAGNDSILGIAPDDGEHEDNWGIGGHATVLGGDGNDYIDVGYSNDSSLDAGAGNDTILTGGPNATINGGSGKNLIQMTATENELGEYVVLNGQTSVEGFTTGFGEGTDTVYMTGESPAVDFKAQGLTLYYDDDPENSLTFSGVSTNTKLNLYYEASLKSVSEVFIADDKWYSVTEDDLSTMDNSELRFVGATAKRNHGIDFSGIESDLNVSLLGHNYPLEVENLLINNVHSIKGGAGLTTLTGSDTSDTIIGGKGETTINAAQGDDLIKVGTGAALIEYSLGDGNDSIYNFNGNSTLSISGGKYSLETQDDKSILHIGDEAITIFGANNGNIIGQRDIPVEELQEIYGDKLTVVSGSVELGDEGAAVAVYEEDTAVDIVGGAGNDTLIALGSAPITFDMSAGGADKVALATANQNVTLEGYDAANGGGIATGNPNRSSMIEEIMAGEDTKFGNGSVTVKTSEETQSVFTFDSSIINFFDAHNRILPVGFTPSSGGILNLSNSSDDYLLLGNYFGEKSGGSTIFGGSGDDTLLGGEGDLLDAGGGYNEIYLAGGGARVGLDNGGRTAVKNFKTGFDGDALYSEGDLAARIRFNGENITASVNGGAKVTLESVADNDDFAEILMYEGEDSTKIAVAKPGGTIKSEDAQVYLGRENAAVDFSGMTDDLLVDLSDEPVVTGSDQKQFFGINKVTAGAGDSSLIGTSGNETLIAGTGNTSIYGGAGYDSLVGNTNKTGSTTFFFDVGSGRDIIDNFDFSADKIDTGDNAIRDASLSRGRVFIDFEDDSRLIINDAAGKNFQIGDMIAKVDNNISYDGLADCYVAAGGSSLTVDSTVESAEIWLDNSHDTQFIGNIRTLDASAVKGNTSLVGNEFNNTIIGGQGDSSLWGGSSTSNDLLIGGAGKNSFFYLQGDGNDNIQNVHDGDEIILDNINLDQISDANISAGGVNLSFTDGGSLTINGTADVTYQLADGSKYSANHERLEWVSK